MAEVAMAPGLAAAWYAAAPADLGGGTRLTVRPAAARVRLQLARPALGRAGELALGGTPLPTRPGVAVGDDPAILWLAPDGWLLVSERHDGTTLARLAREACVPHVAAAVDVSDALVAFELAGPDVRDLLARGTGLSFDEGALATGRCTRTRLAQLPVILRPLAVDRIELTLDRGPAAWFRDWLIDAAGAGIG